MRKDPYFLRNSYPTDNICDIPSMGKNTNLSLDNIGTISFDKIREQDTRDTHKIVHFFIDDHKFNATYDSPLNCLRRIAQYSHILTPDFSLYTDMPLALQIFNTFRNRWCGAYWQSLGLSVFPTIGWSNEKSFDFCFSGVATRSIVAISTKGSSTAKQGFLKGYDEMLKRLDPQLILCFGKPFPEMKGEVVYIQCGVFPKEAKKWVEEDQGQLILDLDNQDYYLKKKTELHKEKQMQQFHRE